MENEIQIECAELMIQMNFGYNKTKVQTIFSEIMSKFDHFTFPPSSDMSGKVFIFFQSFYNFNGFRIIFTIFVFTVLK